MKMFTIVGATGNTGGAAARSLLSRGFRVRALGRSADKLGQLQALGAETLQGDFNDARFLTKAFEGASAIYAMIGPDYASHDPIGDYQRAADALRKAVEQADVPRAVVLSGLGAEQTMGTGPVVGLHFLERAMASTEIDQVVLRPGYYFENFFGALPTIRHAGVNGGVHDPDRPLSMVATADVGKAAADELAAGEFQGVEVRELYADPVMTMSQATRVLGEAIGNPKLPYVRFADTDFVNGLVGAGVSPELAKLLVEMGEAFNAGRLGPVQPRSARNRAPTPFSAFVPHLAGAYAATAASPEPSKG